MNKRPIINDIIIVKIQIIFKYLGYSFFKDLIKIIIEKTNKKIEKGNIMLSKIFNVSCSEEFIMPVIL